MAMEKEKKKQEELKALFIAIGRRREKSLDILLLRFDLL